MAIRNMKEEMFTALYTAFCSSNLTDFRSVIWNLSKLDLFMFIEFLHDRAGPDGLDPILKRQIYKGLEGK